MNDPYVIDINSYIFKNYKKRSISDVRNEIKNKENNKRKLEKNNLKVKKIKY
tara:strand:- start:9875 stop:10030 length:156 start_codon:yes stop_codon:yes gene_type:complete